jgi:hypothetical protein
MNHHANRHDGGSPKYVEEMYDRIHRMEQLIVPSLDISRPAEGNLNHASVGLSKMAHNVVDKDYCRSFQRDLTDAV